MQPFSGAQRPDLLTSLMNMSLVLRLPRKCIFPYPLQMSHACQRFWTATCYKTLDKVHTFDKVHNPLRLPCKTTSEGPKVFRTCGVFDILTWKCASRYSGVHFFDISTSKSGPNVRCFLQFDFQMCFMPHDVQCFHLSSGQTAPHPLASLLFDPPEPQIIGKTLCFTTFLPFPAPACSFFWCFLFSDLLSSSLLFSDSSHLCFSICPYCRKFDF